jgi:hypothetical protein
MESSNKKNKVMKNVEDVITDKLIQQGGSQLLNNLWRSISYQVYNEVRVQVKDKGRGMIWQPVGQNIKL